jgi:plasmid maintenance system antidote protein VapI
MNAETQALINRLNAATTAMAARLQKLLDTIKEDALEPETRAGFEAEIARLEAMGTNPTEPVPA